MIHETDDACCERICTYVIACELSIPFAWNTPLMQNGRKMNVRSDLRLTVLHDRIHYYKQNALGEEYEVPAEGWLPSSTEEYFTPPATEEHLQETEKILGFPLPPFLRALYKRVANGGFGPSQGLLGAAGGGDRDGWLLTDEYLFQKEHLRPIDLSACPRLHRESHGDYNRYLSSWAIVVPQACWPDRLLPLIHDGDGMYFFLDGASEQVFYSGSDRLILRVLAPSLKRFFDRWMRDDLFDYQRSHEERHRSSPGHGKRVESQRDRDVLRNETQASPFSID